ncbi:hypothetical protein ACIN5087_1335 [Acinetobacter baumannii OIFC087]|nr:hypothetical protein ACIN5087_1335 [Acinetobacter baumannii OIFC087]
MEAHVREYDVDIMNLQRVSKITVQIKQQMAWLKLNLKTVQNLNRKL